LEATCADIGDLTQPIASNVVVLPGIASRAAVGTLTVSGGANPISQFESELQALREASAKAYAARSNWKVK
jgi:hypothetical protein